MGSTGAESSPKIEKMQMAASTREEKILVLVRLRPLSDKEILGDEVADWECINDTTVLYRNTLREGSTFPSAYSFDRVFRGDCSTRQVYEDGPREVALSVVSGINASIFAYGQTSSGKTYTMNGITEYTVADIYDYINRHEERAFVLKFSAIEIYNEAIRDLLSTDNASLRLLDDPEKGTVVEKATEETLRDWNHLKELLSVCETQRRIGETFLNEKSSRSHQILRLTIESSSREFLGKENSTTLSATVNFVDLAGSERASQALSSGARLKEGCHINRSLLTLGTVIRNSVKTFSSADNSKGRNGHINYRDSKLTRLLQPALGGNARTAIICTLSPSRSHVEQTRNTLLFACCAKEVTTKAQVNVVMSDKALVKHLQRELARLESELRSPAPASSTSDHTTLLRKKDLQIQKMEKEIRELTKQRDLAESRIQDLLQMIGQDPNSRRTSEISQNPNQHRWEEDECSVSESYPPTYGSGVRRLYGTRFDGDSGTRLQDSGLDDDHSDATSSLFPFGKKIGGSNSRQSLGINGDDDEYCKEVQCIEMDETRQNNPEHHLSSISNGESEAVRVEQEVTTQGDGDREANHLHSNGFTNDAMEQRLHLVDGSSSTSMKLSRSRSSKENPTIGDSTPPHGLERKYAGRPESVRRRFPSMMYDTDASRLTRSDSQSSIESAATTVETQGVATADEDIPTVENFVAGLKEMAKQEYGKQLVDNQALEAEKKKSNVKDIGLDAMLDELTTPDSPLKFERQQRTIIELWHTCNVSLIHRTYFFLLFKGDPLDSIYLEVELRRLSFLKETFSHASLGISGGQTLTLTSSIKALHRERVMLSKLMQRRFSGEERNRLYQKWGIGLNSKRRKLQFVNRLWSNTKDVDHITQSAAIVAKLVRFAEQGQALKEMFGLSFTPPSTTRMKSLGWTYSKSSLL